MESWGAWGVAGLYLACFALSVVSALVPWVNGEVLLLSFTLSADSFHETAALVVAAASGQMLGKCVLYWTARWGVSSHSGRLGEPVTRWMRRLEDSSLNRQWLIFVSSTVGIPPFYVVSILAGSLRLRFGGFLSAGMCGRLVRFSLLATLPQLAYRAWLLDAGQLLLG